MGKSTEKLVRVTRIGLDLAKTVFQVHGVGAEGEVVIARKLRRGTMLEFFRPARALRGGDGGLCFGASWGPPARGAGSRGETDPAGAC